MNDGHPISQPYSRAGLLAKLTGAAILAAGALLHGQGTALLATLPLGTAGRVLVAGASAPAWSDSGLSYASGVLTVAGSVPGTPSSGQVMIGGGAVKAGGALSAASLTATGLTATYIPYATSGGLLTADAGFTRIAWSGGLYTTVSTTVTGTGTGYAARFALTSNPSGDNNGTIQGVEFDTRSTAGNASNYTSNTWGLTGFIAAAQHYGSGTAASVIGAGFGPVARPGCGTVAFMAGFKTLLQNLHTTQAVTEGNGAYIAPPSSAGGNYGTYKGVNIAGTSLGTVNCIGIDIGAMTGTGPFAIRTAAGIVSIGDTTDASAIGTAAHVVAGGGSFAKSLWVGGTAGNYINIANTTGELRVAGTKVVAARKTGWTAQTATAARTDLGAAPTVGAIASFLRALYDDLAGHGLIGA